MSAPIVLAILVLGAIALAFGVGFVMGVQSGGRQATAQVRAIARRAAARSLASGELPPTRRGADAP